MSSTRQAIKILRTAAAATSAAASTAFNLKFPVQAENQPAASQLMAVSACPTIAGFSVSFAIEYSQLCFGEILGRGAYGQVYAGTWQGRPVAIKHFDDVAHCLNESKTLEITRRQLLSDVVVRYDGYAEDRTHLFRPSYCIVTELLSEGSIWDFIKSYSGKDVPWGDCLEKLTSVAYACSKFHRIGMVHGDIKSRNIMLQKNNQVKFIDVGLTTFLEDAPSKKLGSVGTPSHMAPEVITNGEFSRKSDVYALGCLMFEFAVGEPPFAHSGWDVATVTAEVARGTRSSMTEEIPRDVAKLITLCWLQKAQDRPNMNTLHYKLSLLAAAERKAEQAAAKTATMSLRKL